MVGHYTVGAQVILQGVFTGSTGVIDPTSAHLDIITPDGVLATYSGAQITHVSTGVYTYTANTTGWIGTWTYRWWSPPPIGAANTGYFVVDPFTED